METCKHLLGRRRNRKEENSVCLMRFWEGRMPPFPLKVLCPLEDLMFEGSEGIWAWWWC